MKEPAVPSFAHILPCFDAVVAGLPASQGPTRGDYVYEVRDLITRMDPLLERIVEMNRELVESRNARWGIDFETTILEIVSQDPEIKKALDGGAEVRFLDPSESVVRGMLDVDPRRSPIEADLYEATATFYHSAHRLLKALQSLLGKNSVVCDEIMIVRNKLLEHPQGQGTSITLPSFGWGSEGPRMKPMRRASQLEHKDQGLFFNASVLHRKLHQALCP